MINNDQNRKSLSTTNLNEMSRFVDSMATTIHDYMTVGDTFSIYDVTVKLREILPGVEIAHEVVRYMVPALVSIHINAALYDTRIIDNDSNPFVAFFHKTVNKLHQVELEAELDVSNIKCVVQSDAYNRLIIPKFLIDRIGADKFVFVEATIDGEIELTPNDNNGDAVYKIWKSGNLAITNKVLKMVTLNTCCDFTVIGNKDKITVKPV
jgi:hypothetical protein